MNSMILLNAMEHIDERYILSAQNRLGYFTEAAKSRARPVKRLFTVALAAALALLCTLAAAMAVSPEFREAVISLFQLGEVEQVPDVPESGYEVKQVTIGGQVSAQYVKLEGAWDIEYGDGLLTHSDVKPDGSWENTRFYALEGGKLTQVGTDAVETTVSLDISGTGVELRFRSFPYNGRLHLYDISSNLEAHTFLSLYPERLGSRTDMAVLDCEYYDGQAEGHWALVCDLATGQVRDVLADCGLEALGSARPILFTEDLRHALVRAGNDTAEGTPYLVNLEEKTYAPLGELMGLDIPETFGSYQATFYDNDTVLLAMAPLWRPEPSSVWTYHIPSGTVALTAAQEELIGIVPEDPYDWSLAQQTDENGVVTIFDLRTGKQVKLEGITAAGDCYLKINSARTRLLWVDWGDHGLNRLGVIDLESGEFKAFEREKMELRYNEDVFWLGNDRVVTTINLHTGEEYVPGEEEYYLCVYEF